MRQILYVLTKPVVLCLLQLIISLWFQFDFFRTIETSAMNKLWKGSDTSPNKLSKEALTLVDDINQRYCDKFQESEPTFDKLIFIVIDALGAEFIPNLKRNVSDRHQDVYKQTMPFIQSSLSQGKAMGFIARGSSPTVTMPRIKALLSGTNPSFLDIVYNLASDISKFDDDNLVGLAKGLNKSIVFYGDDTWVSLYNRTIFSRVSETFSFFASDYTTIDTNVTNLALPETMLEKVDWDFLILHYLGLDHIGHVFGSNTGNLIDAKLLEMDSVIKQMYSNIEAKPLKTLIVICGDHGMNEQGNHGGESNIETDTAMIFIPVGMNQTDRLTVTNMISQLDLATTLAVLYNLPKLRMSKGVVIGPLLELLWQNKPGLLACIAMDNAIDLTAKLDNIDLEVFKQSLENILNAHANALIDMNRLHRHYIQYSSKVQKQLVSKVAMKSHSKTIVVCLLIVTFLSLITLRRIALNLHFTTLNKAEQVICLLVITIPILMNSSTDFIEFEHYFWPLFAPATFMTFVALQVFKIQQPSNLDNIKLVLFVSTLLVNLIYATHNQSKNSWVLAVVFTTILVNHLRLVSHLSKRSLSAVMVGLSILSTKYVEEVSAPQSNTFKMIQWTSTLQLISMGIVVLYTILNIKSKAQDHSEKNKLRQSSTALSSISTGYLCASCLLARLSNLPFLINNMLLETSVNSILNSYDTSTTTRILLYTIFGQSAFFAQGNTNLFSSLDVKPAFYGQTEYRAIFAVSLVAMSTFSSQVYWLLKLCQRFQESEFKLKGSNIGYVGRATTKRSLLARDLINLRNFLSLSYYMFVCLVLRNHLFIWSVLSPKLIYHNVSNLCTMLAVGLIAQL